MILWAKGVASAATPAVALHHLEQMRHGVVQRMAAMDRLEAAVRAGDPQQARTWADDLAAFAGATGVPWAAAAAAHGQALLSDGANAQSLYELALERHTHSAHKAARARTQLAFGEFLRRSRRRVDARTHLRAALQTFDDLGAAPWAERARQELRASGETARKRDPSTAATLTPQELQVARLIRQGLSNRDAAAQLFLSPAPSTFISQRVRQGWRDVPDRARRPAAGVNAIRRSRHTASADARIPAVSPARSRGLQRRVELSAPHPE